MKYLTTIILSIFLFVGCASIQKYVDQGMDAAGKAAEKAAANYVDKQAGSGTYEDSMKMKDNKDKTENLLPYYVAANKYHDEKKIDDKTRTELKAQFDNYYSDWKGGRMTKEEYDKKCTECLEKAATK